MSAVDYSFARFTVAQLRAAGVTVVIRYLTGAGKAISADELAADLQAGLSVVLVFENGATDASGGFATGAAFARQANAALAALGLPLSTPVYFAADTDYPNPAAALPYYQGLASVRPASTNGVYGEVALLDLLFADGLVGYGWESESTSFPGSGALSPNAALWQKFSGAPLPETDLDLVEKADYGQLPRPNAPGPRPAPVPAPSHFSGDPEMLSDIVEAKPGQTDLFQISPAGDLWHKWSFDGGETWPPGHNEALPSYVKFTVARPLVQVLPTGVAVYVERADTGTVYRAFQAVASSGWSWTELP